MTMRGCTRTRRLCAFWIKYVNIFSVTLKSAMTPSFMGLIATILPGVRPSMSLASLPTASTSPVFLLMATMEGSLTTMPFPAAYTSVLAVPRSIARSLENMLKSERRPWVREVRDGKPFKDIGKWVYLEPYCTAIGRQEKPVRPVGNWYLFLFNE